MSEDRELTRLMDRYFALGPTADAELIGTLYAINPATLRDAIRRIEMRREAGKRQAQAEADSVARVKADAVRALKEAMQAEMRDDNPLREPRKYQNVRPFDQITTTGPQPDEKIRCSEYGSSCSFELEVSEEDPDAAMSEMMRHFRWLHGASRDQAYTMLANIRTVR